MHCDMQQATSINQREANQHLLPENQYHNYWFRKHNENEISREPAHTYKGDTLWGIFGFRYVNLIAPSQDKFIPMGWEQPVFLKDFLANQSSVPLKTKHSNHFIVMKWTQKGFLGISKMEGNINHNQSQLMKELRQKFREK